MFDLVVLDQSKQQFIMSSSDSEDEFTKNFGKVPGEYSPRYYEDHGYGSDPDDSDTSVRNFGSDGVSADLCPVCLCNWFECQCANDAEEWQAQIDEERWINSLDDPGVPRKRGRPTKSGGSRKRARLAKSGVARKHGRSAKSGGPRECVKFADPGVPRKRTKSADQEVPRKCAKLACPEVPCKQEGTSTSDHSRDHPLDQSDDDSHKTDIHENH